MYSATEKLHKLSYPQASAIDQFANVCLLHGSPAKTGTPTAWYLAGIVQEGLSGIHHLALSAPLLLRQQQSWDHFPAQMET